MMSAETIKSSIEAFRARLRNTNLGVREYNRCLRQIEILEEALAYVRTNPNESFVLAERQRLEKIVKAKNNQFSYWNQFVCPAEIETKKRRALFNKETGLVAVKRQLKFLSMLLEE